MYMKNKFLKFLTKYLSNLKFRNFAIKKDKINFLILGLMVVIITSAIFSYSTALKQKRLKAINTFLSNDETILLKNYLLNQIKSPYLEYDYIVKSNDTVESILKKFSVKKAKLIS